MKLLTRAAILWSFYLVFLLVGPSQAIAVEVGEKAPDFELDSTQGGKLKLNGLQGKNVLIQFYVLDFTPG